MSKSSSSPNLLENDDDDVSPISSTAKDNTSSAVDASGDEDSSWRKQSDTSSSPNLVVNGKPNNEVEALDDDESSDEEAPTKAQVVQKAKSVRSTHKKVVEVEAEEEEPLPEKRTRSRFRWSHTMDNIVENANTKDETFIRILLAKEPWNAGHGRVMKAWQELTWTLLETVVDGDKIFQGVSEITLKKRYQLYLDLGKKWDNEREQRNQPENAEDKHDIHRSTATLIRGGIEDLWEEFVMRKESEKEKKHEDSQKESIAKEGAEKIRQFAMGKLRKRDLKGTQKDKGDPTANESPKEGDVDGDFILPVQKTPGNRSTSPVPSNTSSNPLDFVSHRVAMSEERQKRGLELKENKLKLKALREERKAREAANRATELAMQREQNNQQIEMNMKMMEFIGTLSKKHKRHKEE